MSKPKPPADEDVQRWKNATHETLFRALIPEYTKKPA